ncbi:dephospho-CoA kinase [Sinomicrobium kalidii]|uniref:dephospho-CoA kinase n=1 Tax=Sinomicrobium kalidii TaxID=2900738 RepID=UPI001E5620E9|nr:dephospho-CoA kinase [Sinomicrobium kalidii]UGU16242.1 dephospho-CoA kinase [Sinomicrobium kalidii]
MIVGLTGGIGSGKSTVARMFSALGVPVYIADTEAKKLMHTSSKVRAQIVEIFGEKAYTESGLDNAYIAGVVFQDRELLDRLNGIIHPEVGRHFRQWYEKQQAPYVIKEAAILFESGAYKDCDVVITVTAPQETRIERVMQRDGVSREAVENRIKNQWDEARKAELSDHIITNTDLEATQKQVEKLHLRLIKADTSR